MFADIFLVIMLEASEPTGMKQVKNDNNFSVAHAFRLVTMPVLLVFNHIFCFLRRNFLAKSIEISLTIVFRNIVA